MKNNKFIILPVLFFIAFVIAGCGKNCPENETWDKEAKKCEKKPAETTLLPEEKCKKEKTKIWDAKNNKCREKTQSECSGEGIKWEGNKCLTVEGVADTSTGTGTGTGTSGESEELFTITNKSNHYKMYVSVFLDLSILEGVPKSDYHKYNRTGEYGSRYWVSRVLDKDECLSVTKSRLVESLYISDDEFLVGYCSHFSDGWQTCLSDGRDGKASHLVIKDSSFGWPKVEAVADKNPGDCPELCHYYKYNIQKPCDRSVPP